MPKKLTAIFILLLVTVVVFWGFEKSAWFENYKTFFQEQTVPAKLFEKGAFGKVLKELGLVRIEVDSSTQEEESQNDNITDKAKEENYLCRINPDRYSDFPSTIFIQDKTEINTALPVISVFTEDKNLYDKEEGIIYNFNERGRNWERLAYVTYYDKNEIRFSSGAGLRLHGGHSRKKKEKSFRLYFRNKYGVDRIKKGIVFSDETGSTKTLVIHLDRPVEFPFTTSFAFDIASKLGSLVPEIKLAHFSLNDKYQGVYWLSQHLSRRQWRLKFKHTNFSFFIQKSTADYTSHINFHILLHWVSKKSSKITLEDVKRRVSISRLTSNIIFTIFTGYTDGLQGVAIRDELDSDNKWDWILWDVDTCFSDSYGRKFRKSWQQESLELVVNKPKTIIDAQKIIFYKLINESVEYREYFIHSVTNALNHLLTRRFLDEKVGYYQKLSATLNMVNQFNPDIELFLRHRPDFVRKKIKEYFNLGEIVSCTIKNESNIHLNIDGYPYEDNYNGRYFQDSTITVLVMENSRDYFSHWLVNGEIVRGPVLKLKIVADTFIEPVLNAKGN